jgi:hypothetical protein
MKDNETHKIPQEWPQMLPPSGYWDQLEGQMEQRMQDLTRSKRRLWPVLALPLAAALALLIWLGMPQQNGGEAESDFAAYLLEEEGLSEEMLTTALLESEWEQNNRAILPILWEDDELSEEELESLLL